MALSLAALSWPAMAGGHGAGTWYVIAVENGPAIGYANELVAVRPDGGRDVYDSQEIDFSEPGSRTRKITNLTVRREDAGGQTTLITSHEEMGADGATDLKAQIGVGRAEVVRQTRHERRLQSVALPEGVRFDGGQGLLDGWNPAATPELSFNDFDVDAMAVERVVMTAVPRRPSDPPGAVAVVRKRYSGPALVSVARLLIGPDHRVLTVTQPMFGARIVFRAADEQTATRPRPAYRLLPNEFMASPYRISGVAAHGHIRFTFAFEDGMDFPIPATGEQRVGADGGVTVVDICDACGPGLTTDPGTLADALRPTAWLQSDNAQIRALAAPVARMHASDARKMALLSELTASLLPHVDFVGHYTALDALKRRSGDCTETAVLLAALGRAAGIPTRVANGLVYTSDRFEGVANAFIPHSWTLAFVDGHWRSFDPALPAGFDSTHVALNVGDGDARSVAGSGQLASLLVWRGMAEVRARPAS